ncbi:MAG: hypothetical protein ACREBD_05700 [Blastocatellia bacterium]
MFIGRFADQTINLAPSRIIGNEAIGSGRAKINCKPAFLRNSGEREDLAVNGNFQPVIMAILSEFFPKQLVEIEFFEVAAAAGEINRH